MPIQSSRGSLSAKGMGFNVDLGTSEWLWTFRSNPAPTALWYPFSNPAVFFDPITEDAFIYFSVTTGYAPTYLGSLKTVRVSNRNILFTPSVSTNPGIVPQYYDYTIGQGNTTMYGSGSIYVNIGGTYYLRPSIFTNLTNGQPSSGYYVGYSDAQMMQSRDYQSSLSFVSGTATHFYACYNGNATPLRSIFGSLNSSGTLSFSKYLTTSGGAIVYVYHIKYNPADGFVYIAGMSNTNVPFIAKYSTGGVLQWQRQLTNPASAANGAKITFSGTNIVVFYSNLSTTYLVKYSNTGTIITGKTITGVSLTGDGDFQTLPSGNFVLTDKSLRKFVVFNSSLDVVVAKQITATGPTGISITTGSQFYTDKYNNIYIVGHTVSGTSPTYDTCQFVIKQKLYSKTSKSYTVGSSTVTISSVTPTVAALTPTDTAGTHVEATYATGGSATVALGINTESNTDTPTIIIQ